MQCFNSISESPSEIYMNRKRAADRYPKGAGLNPARVNIFQLTSVGSDYHKKVTNNVAQSALCFPQPPA